MPYDQGETRGRRSGPARFRGTPEPLSALRRLFRLLNAQVARREAEDYAERANQQKQGSASSGATQAGYDHQRQACGGGGAPKT